jgi:hypothetical protein
VAKEFFIIWMRRSYQSILSNSARGVVNNFQSIKSMWFGGHSLVPFGDLLRACLPGSLESMGS